MEALIRLNELMKYHTTYQIGGPADFLFEPISVNQLKAVLEICHGLKIPVTVIGGGSNLIVRDKGIRGFVIKTTKLDATQIKGTVVKAQAGVMVQTLIETVIRENLTGLECITGVPGTLGGAIYMNASYTAEFNHRILTVRALDYVGNERIFQRDELDFDFRKSTFHNKKYIIVEAEIQLDQGNYAESRKMVDEFLVRRKERQPTEYPSCGSVFIRPPKKLKVLHGLSFGNAQLQQKFIVNKGGATADDVLKLIQLTEKKLGQKLTLEAEVIGDES